MSFFLCVASSDASRARGVRRPATGAGSWRRPGGRRCAARSRLAPASPSRPGTSSGLKRAARLRCVAAPQTRGLPRPGMLRRSVRRSVFGGGGGKGDSFPTRHVRRNVLSIVFRAYDETYDAGSDDDGSIMTQLHDDVMNGVSARSSRHYIRLCRTSHASAHSSNGALRDAGASRVLPWRRPGGSSRSGAVRRETLLRQKSATRARAGAPR